MTKTAVVVFNLGGRGGLEEAGLARARRRGAVRGPVLRGLCRHAVVAAGNSGESKLRPSIERHAESEDPMLREHANWALARLDSLES